MTAVGTWEPSDGTQVDLVAAQRVAVGFYDDGGFSGGTLERPAMQRLLVDVEAGKIDCIVVYKVDRLSRSLLDFARVIADSVGGADAPRRLADLQDRIQAGQSRLTEIAGALSAAGPEVTADTVQAALATFDTTWDTMPVADQCRLLSLLVEKVTYDGETIALTFRQNGFTEATHEQATDY